MQQQSFHPSLLVVFLCWDHCCGLNFRVFIHSMLIQSKISGKKIISTRFTLPCLSRSSRLHGSAWTPNSSATFLRNCTLLLARLLMILCCGPTVLWSGSGRHSPSKENKAASDASPSLKSGLKIMWFSTTRRKMKKKWLAYQSPKHQELWRPTIEEGSGWWSCPKQECHGAGVAIVPINLHRWLHIHAPTNY